MENYIFLTNLDVSRSNEIKTILHDHPLLVEEFNIVTITLANKKEQTPLLRTLKIESIPTVIFREQKFIREDSLKVLYSLIQQDEQSEISMDDYTHDDIDFNGMQEEPFQKNALPKDYFEEYEKERNKQLPQPILRISKKNDENNNGMFQPNDNSMGNYQKFNQNGEEVNSNFAPVNLEIKPTRSKKNKHKKNVLDSVFG